MARPRPSREPLPPGFGTIWTTVALDLVGFGIVIPILGRYAERYGASGIEVGLLFATFSLAQLLAAPLLGRLSDRVGRKPVIVISLLGTCVGSVVTGAAGALWVLYLGRVIDGFSGGSASVAQAAVIDIAPPHQRARLMGLLGSAFGVGFVLGPAIGGLAALGGPHVPFYVAAAVAGVNALAALVRLPETRERAQRPAAHGGTAHSLRLRPLNGTLATFALVGFLTTFAVAAFEGTFGLFGERRFDLTEGSTAAVFLFVGVILVGVQGGVIGPAAARWGAGTVLRASLVVMGGALALLAGADGWPVLLLALGLMAAGQGLATPAVATLVSERVPPERRGQALGFQQSAASAARIVGPAVGGVLFDHAGVGAPFLLGTALCMAAILVLAVRRPDRVVEELAAVAP